MRTVPGRRGIQLAALLALLLIMVGIGAGLMNLAQQAGRSGHWFEHGQIAHDIADAALKQAYAALWQANSKAAAAGKPPLERLFEAVTAGKIGAEVTLLDSASAAPPPIGDLLARYPYHAPRVTVTARVIRWAALPPAGAIPYVPGEARGGVLIVSRASVKTPAGVAIERGVALEKEFKVVSPTAPLVGRFGLFVESRGTESLDRVPMRFDPSTGDAQPSGVRPLVLESGAKGPIVSPGTATLDRAAFVNGLARDPGFLDTQGWVYLGAPPGQKWVVTLAHGYSDSGETPLLPGARPEERELFRDSESEHQAFIARFREKTQEVAPGAPYFPDHGRVDDPRTPKLGFYPLLHGFAENYEVIGLDPVLHERVAPGGTRGANMDFGSGDTSLLRLFGTPDAMSPTLVFGPVYRRVLRRSALFAAFESQVDAAGGGVWVYQLMQLYRLEGLPGLQRAILEHAFQGENARHGTRVDEAPFTRCLATVLAAGASGDYRRDGTLARMAPPGATPAFTSALGLGKIASEGWPSAEVENALMKGELKAPAVFSGTLNRGLAELVNHLGTKATFAVKGGLPARMLTGKRLRIPGVVLVEGDVTVPEIDQVDGGVLFTDGKLTVTGNIVRPSADEPLTLIARGDIVLGSGVTRVDAVLVSIGGAVRWPAGDVTVNGGVAGATLDVSGLATPGRKRVVYTRDADPTGPNREKLRVYYGGDDRIAIIGATS